ncbi:hypothetical protein ACTWQF_22910 [Streptomyces sp. 8N114]|uniref:hypothetical protein n=1 Tax=Streptomyces sp. 8N114 TaxID=3457419 RepID=UPI003FD0D41D
MHTPTQAARLLPWESPEGKPCYVVGDGTGHVSRLADDVERVQLAMAADLMEYADDMFADRRITADQLLYVGERLAESLRVVHRIARSRGDRIPR